MAKRVQISIDNGVAWATLPGNRAELTNEAGDIRDTIFGQSFASTQTGLIGAMINANGLYKGFAGYVAKLLKSGTSTALTAEPMSLVTGKTYRITDVAKRVMNRAVAYTVSDTGGAILAANILSVDYLFGRITFISSFTPTGAVTISGAYFPMTQVGRGNGFTLTQTAAAVDNTDFETAQANAGHRTFEYGLKTVSLSINGIYSAANGFRALLDGRTELMIEVNPDGNGKSVARGWFKAMNTSQSGDVGDLEAETIAFNLAVPDQANIDVPFQWTHNTTTLNTAIQSALNCWQNSVTTDVLINYLYDGTNGIKGTPIFTDLTLTGGLEVMNEFAVRAQLTGALTPVP
jgi:hypothetical protein